MPVEPRPREPRQPPHGLAVDLHAPASRRFELHHVDGARTGRRVVRRDQVRQPVVPQIGRKRVAAEGGDGADQILQVLLDVAEPEPGAHRRRAVRRAEVELQAQGLADLGGPVGRRHVPLEHALDAALGQAGVARGGLRRHLARRHALADRGHEAGVDGFHA